MTAPPPIRIADFSTHLSGPLGSHLLAEIGAQVVKIENPRTGDGNRGNVPLIRDVGMMHVALNAGAKSLAIDRRAEDWPELIAACAQWADAVLVGARPADAKRRGMDFETMAASNPRLIYCSLSGFGDRGPWRDYPAHGQTIDALAGLVPVEPGDPQPKTRAGWRTAGTTLAGVFAALGVLAALHRRDGGHDQPQYLSVSLWGAAMWWSWRDVTMLANTGEPWFDYSDLGSRYSLYSTKDERVILIAVSEQRFWMRFCEILGLPEAWHDRGEWTRSGMDHGEGPAHDDERLQIARQMRTRDLGDWIAAFEEADLPFAPILTIDEALASEHASANAVLRETTLANEPAQIPAIPVRFGTPDQPDDLSPMSEPPGLGTHSEEIRAVLGLSTAADRTPPDA